MRRTEFAQNDLTVAMEILTSARYGQLATCSPQGEPEIRPMNYAVVGDRVYFHCAENGALGNRAGANAVLSAVDAAVWLPSYWRNADMACPATTWYRSVQVRGTLRAVVCLEEKARALGAFMVRYQPEGRHRAIRAEGKYVGPLRAITVLALPLDSVDCKIKVGQHLTPQVRVQMHERLQERGQRDDWAALRWMERANAEFAPAYPSRDELGLRWVDDAAEVPLQALFEMLDAAFPPCSQRPSTRTIASVAENLRTSTLTLAAFDGNRLVAHARACVVHPRVAWLFDVAVEVGYRGRGIGKRLVERTLAHRSVAAIPRVFLDTSTAMGLYARYGFVDYYRDTARDSSLMVRDTGREAVETIAGGAMPGVIP